MADWDRRAEMLRVSLEALGRYRLRTALSTLGIVLGIAAVIAMLSVGEGRPAGRAAAGGAAGPRQRHRAHAGSRPGSRASSGGRRSPGRPAAAGGGGQPAGRASGRRVGPGRGPSRVAARGLAGLRDGAGARCRSGAVHHAARPAQARRPRACSAPGCARRSSATATRWAEHVRLDRAWCEVVGVLAPRVDGRPRGADGGGAGPRRGRDLAHLGRAARELVGRAGAGRGRGLGAGGRRRPRASRRGLDSAHPDPRARRRAPRSTSSCRATC